MPAANLQKSILLFSFVKKQQPKLPDKFSFVKKQQPESFQIKNPSFVQIYIFAGKTFMSTPLCNTYN